MPGSFHGTGTASLGKRPNLYGEEKIGYIFIYRERSYARAGEGVSHIAAKGRLHNGSQMGREFRRSS